MKLFNLLGLIKKTEWRDFEKFVASPYFNKGRNYGQILKILKKHHPDFSHECLTKEFLYGRIYPGRKYNEDVINTVLSGLSLLCEEYILYANFRENPQRDIRLLREYSKRGYESKAARVSESINKDVKSKLTGGMNFFDNLDKLDALQSYHAMNYDKEKRSAVINSGIKNLIYFMMMQSFIFEKELLLYGKRYADEDFSTSYSGKLLSLINFDKLLELIRAEDQQAYTILSLYSLLVKQLEDIANDEIYFKLKQMLEDSRDKLSDDTIKKLLLNIVSICNMKNNRGKKDFMNEGYNFMKQLAESNFYDNLEGSPHFPPSHFRNIVKAGVALGDIEWVKKFINENAHKLEHSLESSLKHYSLAKIAFVEGDYDSALGHLGKVDSENLVFKLDIKKLYSMIFFETGSFENLRSLLNTYNQSVSKRVNKNESILLRHRNFIRYLRMIINKAEAGNDEAERHALLKSLMKENVSEKTWLVEKLEAGNS